LGIWQTIILFLTKNPPKELSSFFIGVPTEPPGIFAISVAFLVVALRNAIGFNYLACDHRFFRVSTINNGRVMT